MSKNKKKFLSVLLAFAMLCSIVSPAWAEVPRSDTGYYALENAERGQKYISSILIGYHSKYAFNTAGETDSAVKDGLKQHTNDLGDYLDKELNDGAGGDYLYLGWDGTNDPNEAITGLRLLKGENDNPPTSYIENGVKWSLVNKKLHVQRLSGKLQYTLETQSVDLNEEAGGDYIFLYYTKDSSFGPPLQTIKFTEKTSIALDNYHDKIVRFGDHEWYDVNAKAGGDYIYLYTMTGFQPVDIPKLSSLLELAEICLESPENYVDTSALQLAHLNGTATLKEWGDDQYYDGSVSMTTQVPSDIAALQKALRELVRVNNVDGNEGDHEGITKPEWPGFDNINQEMWNNWWSDSSQLWKQWADQYDWSDYKEWYDWANKYDWSDLSDWSDKYNWYNWSDKHDGSDLSEWYHFYRK